MFARHVTRQTRLSLRQVVCKDTCITHELAVLIDHQWNGADWVLCQEIDLLVLPCENIDFYEIVVNA